MKRTLLLLATLLLATASAASAATDHSPGDHRIVCDNNVTVEWFGSHASLTSYLATHDGSTVGACIPATPPVEPTLPTILESPAQTFLCFSHFNSPLNVPSAVYFSDVAADLARGWFVPAAILGTAADQDNVGPYHLVCNIDGLKPAGIGLNGSGGDADVMGATAWAQAAADITDYGTEHINHYEIYS